MPANRSSSVVWYVVDFYLGIDLLILFSLSNNGRASQATGMKRGVKDPSFTLFVVIVAGMQSHALLMVLSSYGFRPKIKNRIYSTGFRSESLSSSWGRSFQQISGREPF